MAFALQYLNVSISTISMGCSSGTDSPGMRKQKILFLPAANLHVLHPPCEMLNLNLTLHCKYTCSPAQKPAGGHVALLLLTLRHSQGALLSLCPSLIGF